MSSFNVLTFHLFTLSLLTVFTGQTTFARLSDTAASFTHSLRSLASSLPLSSSSSSTSSSSSSPSSSLPHTWTASASSGVAGASSSAPWRGSLQGLTVRNRTVTPRATKRSSRFADFTDDDSWIPIADESAPFLSPMGGGMPPGSSGPSSGGPPGSGGMSYPLFTPNVGPSEFVPLRGPGHRSRSPFPLLDYDRSSPPHGHEGRSAFPSYYDGPKDRGSLSPPGQMGPPQPPPPPPPPPSSSASAPRYSAHGSSPSDRRYRPDRSKSSPYGPYGPSGPDSSGSRPPGKGRKGSSSGDNMYGPSDPYYDYDGNGGGGPPTYSYNPSEIPRCAKESNVSYCTEDSEYPIETMQYEIDRDASILEQIMPDSEEKMDLVEGIPKKDDEKYNFRHYFTYRLDELENQTKNRGGDSMSFGLKPDYYKDGGYICPSLVSYVQPRRARNTEGLWKVVLNLRERYKGLDYRQTVRLEQCMHTGRECSFTSAFYSSQCIQKFSNERLLAWTEERGIHLDVFKLPIACSCFFKGKGAVKMN